MNLLAKRFRPAFAEAASRRQSKAPSTASLSHCRIPYYDTLLLEGEGGVRGEVSSEGVKILI